MKSKPISKSVKKKPIDVKNKLTPSIPTPSSKGKTKSEPKVVPSLTKTVRKSTTAAVPDSQEKGLSIDYQTRHIHFGANRVPTKIQTDESRFIPEYANPYAACADLVANIHKDSPGAQFDSINQKWVIQIPSRVLVKIHAGFSMQLPPGWQAEVMARSGWAEQGLVILNSPGQIDEDYRGPVSVLLGNVGKNVIAVRNGDRIGQIKPTPVFRFDWEVVDNLDETERGEKGFGSTGGMS